jgi:hypothetical protein
LVKGKGVQGALKNGVMVQCVRGILCRNGYHQKQNWEGQIVGSLLGTETLFSRQWRTTEVLGKGNDPLAPEGEEIGEINF